MLSARNGRPADFSSAGIGIAGLMMLQAARVQMEHARMSAPGSQQNPKPVAAGARRRLRRRRLCRRARRGRCCGVPGVARASAKAGTFGGVVKTNIPRRASIRSRFPTKPGSTSCRTARGQIVRFLRPKACPGVRKKRALRSRAGPATRADQQLGKREDQPGDRAGSEGRGSLP